MEADADDDTATSSTLHLSSLPRVPLLSEEDDEADDDMRSNMHAAGLSAPAPQTDEQRLQLLEAPSHGRRCARRSLPATRCLTRYSLLLAALAQAAVLLLYAAFRADIGALTAHIVIAPAYLGCATAILSPLYETLVGVFAATAVATRVDELRRARGRFIRMSVVLLVFAETTLCAAAIASDYAAAYPLAWLVVAVPLIVCALLYVHVRRNGVVPLSGPWKMP